MDLFFIVTQHKCTKYNNYILHQRWFEDLTNNDGMSPINLGFNLTWTHQGAAGVCLCSVEAGLDAGKIWLSPPSLPLNIGKTSCFLMNMWHFDCKKVASDFKSYFQWLNPLFLMGKSLFLMGKSSKKSSTGWSTAMIQVYVKELRTDIQGLLEEQRANAKVYGGEDGIIWWSVGSLGPLRMCLSHL